MDLNQFKSLPMKILLGLTHAATKFNLPSKDCICLKDAESFF